ncbi:hypothetical protein ACVWWG_002006 [Bradyrhizobium sp. LB7.2]
MRGRFTDQGGLFSYIAPDKRVPANHPLRKVRELVRDVLSDLNRSLGKLYASEGRPSIPPEQLLSALILGYSTPVHLASPRQPATISLNAATWSIEAALSLFEKDPRRPLSRRLLQFRKSGCILTSGTVPAMSRRPRLARRISKATSLRSRRDGLHAREIGPEILKTYEKLGSRSHAHHAQVHGA